jgi:phage gp46-like protein
MNLQSFEGDLLLYETPDGGDVHVEDGLFSCDRAYDTAVYLSLFGGNKEDSGKVKNRKTWWGNTLRGVTESQKLVSRFQALISGLPMTTKNILAAEDAAKLDLGWMVDEKLADEIFIDGRAVSINRLKLKIQVNAKGKPIYSGALSVPWKAGANGAI